MQANLLILHPADPEAVLEENALVESLGAIDFLAEPMDFEGQRHFRPGDDFLQLVTFLGCSPVVSLGEPGATGDEFCHIAFRAPSREPELVAGANVKAPRCPACRKPDSGWQHQLNLETPLRSDWICPHCGHRAPASALNWRQSAGIARTFVIVWGIFEGEAVPSEQLLSTLAEVGFGPWTYFYYRGAALL